MRKKTLQRIELVNQLIKEYGIMTLRQIYYQLAPKGLEYRQVGYVCKLGRERGLIPANAIVDRARPCYDVGRTFEDLEEFTAIIPDYFKLDYWKDSENHIEIWTEKDALSQVLYEIAKQYQVTVRVTRGFLSISNKLEWSDENLTILYFGDFDPSGLFIDKDLKWSSLGYEKFRRIALTEEQVKRLNLPSVGLKEKDPRRKSYQKEYGNRAWELDAMNPNDLQQLVRETIREYVDFDLQQKRRMSYLLREELKRRLT